MSRRTARELAMKLLYQFEIQKNFEDEQYELFFAENGSVEQKDETFIRELVSGTVENVEKIDKLIEDHAKGWKLSRLSKVDLSIIRLSVYEIIHRKDIPTSVSINEAIELAKKYSSDEAGSFVNGILGKLAQDVTQNGMPESINDFTSEGNESDE